MDQIEQQRLKRREREAAGICIRCGFNPARHGRKMCFACALRAHEYYERRKSKLGIYQGQMGRKPVYLYTVYDGDQVIFRGTSGECAEHFGVTKGAICHNAACNRRIKALYPVTRERIVYD